MIFGELDDGVGRRGSDDDPRVGSSRDNSSSTSLAHVPTGVNSASLSGLLNTLLPILIFSGACLLVFFVLRNRCPRVYAPRTILSTLQEHERSEPLPSGFVNWLPAFFRVPDTYVLNHSSLDGYLFLRFIKVLCVVMLVGCCFVWPVLLPLHALGGGGIEQLDKLTIGNITISTWYYGHAAAAWCFFSFILYTVIRECVYYVNLRQAYLLSPYYAQRISSKTVLFTCVPQQYLDEARLRRALGDDAVARVWIPRDTKQLWTLVQEREQTASRLERAEIKLIKMADAQRKRIVAGKAGPLVQTQQLQQTVAQATSITATPPTTGTSSPRRRLTKRKTPEVRVSVVERDEADSSHNGGNGDVSRDQSASGEGGGLRVASEEEIRPATGPEMSSQSFHTADSTFQPAPVSPMETTEPVPPAPVSPIEIEPVAMTSPTSEAPFSPLSGGAPLLGSPAVRVSDAGEADLEKEGGEDKEDLYGLGYTVPDVNGSVAAVYIPAEKRPHHRPLANFGRRVDTIKWTRHRLKVLSGKIYKARRQYRSAGDEGGGRLINAAFVEFRTQAAAQSAYQTLPHQRPSHFSPRFIGIRPHEIVWSSLRFRWWERIVRRFAIMGLITFFVIFWSLPSALVGTLSNITFLAKTIPFLGWLNQLPSQISGIVTGLIPAVALSVFMAAVPMMLRACARAAGIPSLPLIELFVQNTYFVFQVVQVFLVTTLTSAASAAITDVILNPLLAKDLLSQNLPKASNFYLSYILVQCLAVGALSLIHPFDLIRHQLWAKSIDNPRLMYRVWNRLRRMHWGSIFPVFTNMGVIAISYSCIAPLILAFAAVGLYFVYLVYKYNLLYCYSSEIDTRGLVYPYALMHLLVGLYLAEICMVGLFILRGAFGPMLLMILFLVFTCLVHISLNDAISPLLYNLPRILSAENEHYSDPPGQSTSGPVVVAGNDADQIVTAADQDIADANKLSTSGGEPTTTVQPVASASTATTATGPHAIPPNSTALYYDDPDEIVPDDDDDHIVHGESTNRGGVSVPGVEGSAGFLDMVFSWLKKKAHAKIDKSKTEMQGSHPQLFTHPFLAYLKNWVAPLAKDNPKPGFLLRWLHPEVFEDFDVLRHLVAPDLPIPSYSEDVARRAFYPPAVNLPPPKLWIPRDDGKVSAQEVRHSGRVVKISDEGAWLNEKGAVTVDLEGFPWREPVVAY